MSAIRSGYARAVSPRCARMVRGRAYSEVMDRGAGPAPNPSVDAEHEDLIMERLARRIRGARSNPSPKRTEARYLLSDPEYFWDRHLGDLVKDALKLGVARARGLAPFGELIGETFATTRYLLAGYVQLAGEMNDLALSKWMPQSPRTAPKIRALAQLHGRALILIEEIFVLTTMGYPSGALALARTLHEVRVVAKFLHRFEAKLSERYLDSHIVDMWKSIEDFRPVGAARRSGKWLAIESELETRFNAIIATHGESMLIENGWALPRFIRKDPQARSPRRIPFSRLESEVKQPWDRARYRFASRHVHATRLGGISALRGGDPNTGLLGPRPHDLDRAADQAMWDLQSVTESLMRSCGKFLPDEDIYYWLEALDQLAFVIRGSLSQGQQVLDDVFATDIDH